MAKATPRQRRTEGRVMHEFAHGELKSGRGGKGGKVKSRKQAIAIALSEAGASKFASKRKNRSARARTERKEAQGRTAQQERVVNRDLEADFEALFRETKGRLFVAWSAQNVDRTVTLYRACLKTANPSGRPLHRRSAGDPW